MLLVRLTKTDSLKQTLTLPPLPPELKPPLHKRYKTSNAHLTLYIAFLSS